MCKKIFYSKRMLDLQTDLKIVYSANFLQIDSKIVDHLRFLFFLS
jgi:hypothetical protein